VDVFHITRDLRDESSFERTLTGSGLRMGYRISEAWSQSWRYRLSKDEVTNVDSDASLLIKEQEGSAIKSEVGQSISLDTRDDRIEPKNGLLALYSVDVAGLGGDVRFVRNRVKATQYFPLGGRLTGSVGAEAGYLIGLGQDTRIVDRFFLGGDNLRGFANYGAGPRDLASDDAVGGNWMYNGSVQVEFPLGLPNEFGIRGRAFTDFGSAGKVDSNIATVSDSASIRTSLGFGLTWKSAFGPISIDFAQPVVKEDYDETELVRFNFGTRF
jgi:outer membrane protein insertion porin family